MQINRNGTTKFYVDIDDLAAFIEANYNEMLTNDGRVSRSALMEALYEIFHK